MKRHLNRSILVLLAAGLGLSATAVDAPGRIVGRGGGEPASETPPAPVPAGSAEDRLVAHLRDLDAKISRLEARIEPRTLAGRGAFAGGSGLLVGLPNGSTGGSTSGKDETLLERMRRLEREVGESRALASEREQALAATRVDLERARDQGKLSAEQVDALSHTRDNLITAQQALNERQGAIASLSERLTTTELARLRSEREFYRFAANVLKLTPGQTAELAELQDALRQHLRELMPAKDAKPTRHAGESAAKPVDPSAAPIPAPAPVPAPAHGGH